MTPFSTQVDRLQQAPEQDGAGANDDEERAAEPDSAASSAGDVPLNLGRLRQERGLSLAALAELTGVSKSMLRQIEMGQSSPTIATLWKIANGLRVPLSVLLVPPAVQVTVRDMRSGTPLYGDTTGYRIYPLVSFAPDRGLELYLAELDPGTRLEADGHPQHTVEHVLLQQGTLQVAVGEQLHTVLAGQIISFGADQPHAYQAQGDTMVVCVMVLSYRF